MRVAIIGSGFGGLGAAMRCVDAGAEVVVYERLRYPGGCASTFERGGRRYESGATLFSGFGDGQLFRRWIDAHSLPVEVQFHDPLVTLKAPTFELPISGDRRALIARLCALTPDRADDIQAFFAFQESVADALWTLFDDPALLPPFQASALLAHVRRVPEYLPLLRHLGRPLQSVVARFDLSDVEPLAVFLDAVCQITVQAPAREAEAAFALGAMDYYFRGTGHVRGGIGVLAHALCDTMRIRGADIRFSDEVRSLERVGNQWRVRSRRGEDTYDAVLANLLPRALMDALPIDVNAPPTLTDLDTEVRAGWGAAMLYLTLDPNAGISPGHYELVANTSRAFTLGNHVFCSVGTAEEGGGAPTVTVSTHVPIDEEGARDDAAFFDDVHLRMRRTIAQRMPELAAATVHSMTGSPRTFERFTARPSGYVGGIPRRAGLHNYMRMWPAPVSRGLYMVGDTVFPGQSTLATALGGVKTAEAMLATR